MDKSHLWLCHPGTFLSPSLCLQPLLTPRQARRSWFFFSSFVLMNCRQFHNLIQFKLHQLIFILFKATLPPKKGMKCLKWGTVEMIMPIFWCLDQCWCKAATEIQNLELAIWFAEIFCAVWNIFLNLVAVYKIHGSIATKPFQALWMFEYFMRKDFSISPLPARVEWPGNSLNPSRGQPTSINKYI